MELKQTLEQVVDHLRPSSLPEGATTASPKPWDNVVLTPDEMDTIIEAAKEAKYWRLENERIAEEKRRYLEWIDTPFTATELFNYVSARGKTDYGLNLSVDDQNREVVDLLLWYFSGDASFDRQRDGFNLEKGLLLMGNVGTGKTTLMRLFSRNKRQCYNVIPCARIAALYARDGAEALRAFYEAHYEPAGDFRVFNQRQIGYCFDDLGTENVKKNYGNELNVMEDIILARYDRRYEFPWFQTHITTNLTFDEIEQYYGSRVRSRIREMFNIIVLDGEDRRK